MKKGRTAIVHIGHKKTGTTAIQTQFHGARRELLGRGLLYPLPEANHSFALSGIFRGGGRSRAVAYAADAAGSLARLDAELNAADWTHVMFSAESLAGFEADEMIALRDWLLGHVETIVVAFVIRDPVDWAVSVAQQNAKSRGDFAEILANPEPVAWREIIERLHAVFGEKALALLEYEQLAEVRERFAGRFARALGLPRGVPRLLLEAQAAVNESLPAEAAAMLSQINAAVPATIDGVPNPARTGYELRAFIGLAGHRFDLPDEARRLAYKQSRDDVAYVSKQFGITRYDYPESRVKPSGFTTETSDAFLTSVGQRLVALNNEVFAGRMLMNVLQMRLKGKEEEASKALQALAKRFPEDRRVLRELAAEKRRG